MTILGLSKMAAKITRTDVRVPYGEQS